MFVSYAQNFEDVMLQRVFGSTMHGFYVDIGAWHPDLDSVTKHFYRMGWNGINVEPSRFYFKLLKSRRKRDINLNVAVGVATGSLDFVEVRGSGLSSLGEDAAARGIRHGFSPQRYRIPVITLQEIFERYCANKLVSFLKIDVEGYEKEVIESLDWKANRPVLVLAEAVHPDSREPAWDSWEAMLLDAGYLFVWFDGINRYYLRNESEELRKHFLVAPGLVDAFVINPNHPLSMGLGQKIRAALDDIFRRD